MENNSQNSEFFLVLDLQSQLKGWLEENKDRFQTKPLQTLVINKILYYTSRKKLPITSGWYRYGPCIETFRVDNELAAKSLEFLDAKTPHDEVLIEECEAHFSQFFADASKYNEKYLKYIYEKRCDVSQLQDVYISKHALMNALYQQASKRSFFEIEDIIRKVTRFNSAIAKKEYRNFVNLPNNTMEKMLNFGLITIESFESASEDKKALEVLQKDIAHAFNEDVFKTLSFLNYKATLNTSKKKNLDTELDLAFNNSGRIMEDFIAETNKKLAARLGYTDEQVMRLGSDYGANENIS